MNYESEFSRNLGFWSKAEQEALNSSTVALGGAGGDGFQLGYKLAMMGVRNFRVADPEVFEIENSNRVPGATRSNIGRNKAEVLAEWILNIRPGATVDVYPEGITADNVAGFVRGSNLAIDETELTYPEVGTALAREARRNGIPNLLVMNVGFSAIATSFEPNSAFTFERLMGLPENAPLSEISEMGVDFSRCLPYLPTYVDVESLIAVQNGAKLPSIAQGVDIASGLGATEAFLHLTRHAGNRRRRPTWAPRFRFMDAYNGRSGSIRFPRIGYQLGAMTMAIRSRLGLNPKCEYPPETQ